MYAGFSGYDYHVHSGGGGVKTGWKLPKNVAYEWGGDLIGVNFEAGTGRVVDDLGNPTSLDVVLIDTKSGARDTVSVEGSGYVVEH
jgi:hypothetical protein